MPVPDFAGLLVQFEQMDMQQEQLELQRQEQAARNIAQAVSTLVQIAPEGRAGYLQTVAQETGLNTSFLDALARNTPTPTAIMLGRGLEQAINQGDVSPQTIAANAMGMKPIEFEIQSQMSDYARTGKLPKFISGIKDPAQRDAALQNFLAQSAGNASIQALQNQADPLLTRDQEKKGARVGSNIELGADRAAQIDQAFRQMLSGERVAFADMANRRQITAVNNASSEYIAGLGLYGRLNDGTGGRGAGAKAKSPKEMSDNELNEAYVGAIKLDLDTQSADLGLRGYFPGAEEAIGLTRTASGGYLRELFEEKKRRAAAGAQQLLSPPPAPVPDMPRPDSGYMNFPTGGIMPFAPVQPANLYRPR